MDVGQCSSVINYGCDRVRFLSPVRIPAGLRGRGMIVAAAAVGGGVQVSTQLAIELEGTPRPAYVVTSILRYLD
jgi:acyl dehydratase